MSFYAVDMRSPNAKKQPGTRKREPVSYDPLHDGAKLLADYLYESALQLSKVLAPERPGGTQELDDQTTWHILETMARNRPPHVWEDPDAIEDLLRLRQEFVPRLAEKTMYLKAIAKMRRTTNKALPDPNITPVSPEWERRFK